MWEKKNQSWLWFHSSRTASQSTLTWIDLPLITFLHRTVFHHLFYVLSVLVTLAEFQRSCVETEETHTHIHIHVCMLFKWVKNSCWPPCAARRWYWVSETRVEGWNTVDTQISSYSNFASLQGAIDVETPQIPEFCKRVGESGPHLDTLLNVNTTWIWLTYRKQFLNNKFLAVIHVGTVAPTGLY